MSTNPLLKKLRGYHKAPRDRFLLLLNGTLTQEQFIVYEFAIAITDWDEEHETFGTFKATNLQMAKVLGWEDDSSVSRYKKDLIEKNLLVKLPDGYFKIKDCDKWLTKQKNTDSSESAILQTKSADIQKGSAEMQNYPAYFSKGALVSSKGGVNVSRKRLNESLSDEELEFIANEIDNTKLISLKTEESPKTLDQMPYDEMLSLGIEIFGVGTRLEEANG